MNLVGLLRQSKSPFNCSTLLNTIRGAKRKGEKKQEGVMSEHILNVYKNAEDVQILPDEYYPKWVFDLSRPQMKLEEFIGNAIIGTTLPNPSDQFTMLKKYRRIVKFKIANKNRHAMARWDRDCDEPVEADEHQLDIEMGEMPQILEDIAKEEQKKMEAQEGGSSGGGGAAAAEKKAE